MADDLRFKETETTLEVIAGNNIIINNEKEILEENIVASVEIFKTKVKSLITRLEKRDVTREQIINVLLDDFENDGELFGGLKNSIANSVTETLGNVENYITVDQWEQEQSFAKYTWIAALVNTCKDCLPFHGKSKSFDEWQSSPGLPRSGWSVCRSKCQCTLIPSTISESKAELQEPIKRAKPLIKKVAKEKDVKSVSKYVNRKLGSINNTKDPIRSTYRKVLPGFKR